MRIHHSARKHGCSSSDIDHAVRSTLIRRRIGDDPDRWLYIGVDGSGRALEIVTLTGDDGTEVVIHAMRLRKQYHPKGGSR